MNEIRSLLRTAASRIEFSLFLKWLHVTGVACAALALFLMLADRLPSTSFIPWIWAGPVMAGVAALTALLMWHRQRPRELHIALTVDERLDLREKLSTALHCQGRTDPFAQAAVEDAVTIARDAKTKERVRRHFHVKPPNEWWISPLLIVLTISASFVPSIDLFARDEPVDPLVNVAREDAEQSIDAVVKAIQQQPELSRELSEMIGELSKDGIDPNALRTPESVKREALKKVTDLNKKLDEILNGEKGKTAAAVDEALKQLKGPEKGAGKELVDALARGNFGDAQQAMEQLMKKLEQGELTEEEKEKAAEQLAKIAEQLKALAQKQNELEQALKQAGLDSNLAQNPAALEQAIQNNENLNEQQKQQLQQMAQAQQAANQMLQELGQGMQGLAEAMQGMAEAGQAGQQMAQQLGQMEQLQQLLMEAQAAAGMCQGQADGIGQGLNMQQAMEEWMRMNQGQGGFGGAGTGRGGKAPIAPTPTGTKIQKANVKTTEGDVIARELFEGPQIRGESKAKIVQVVREANSGFDEAVTEDQLPRQYHDPIKHYFGELKKITEAIEQQPSSEESSDADAPGAESDE